MMENNTAKFIKKVKSQADVNQMERFVSYGEIFEELGLDIEDRHDLYDRGWYKSEIMTWNEYLFERYKEEHPDDPNIKYHDSNKLIELDWYVPDM